jgi:hypothetical protein
MCHGLQRMQLPSSGGAAIAEDTQGQQATAWLHSLGLQHLVQPLQQRSLLSMRALLATNVSALTDAGCSANEAQVIVTAAAAAASASS